jgi:proline iminopeptidase
MGGMCLPPSISSDRPSPLPAGLLVIGVLLLSGSPRLYGIEETGAKSRETVLDRVVHLEKELQEVPAVPPLCDSFKGDKRRINVGDCELYCETEGQGLPLVLINGGPGATHHGFHPHFSRAAQFAQVVYYDQRGCGVSEYKAGSGYRVDQAVDDLDALRAALKIDRWVVLGWSYGGLLAQCYCVKYPERVAGLVLLCASPAMPLSLNRTRQYDFLSKEELKRIGEIQRTPQLSIEKLVYNAHLNGDWKRQAFYRPSPEELARMARYEWKHDPVFRNQICGDMGNVNLRSAYKNCPLPILILEGAMDLTWNTDKLEKFQQCFPGAKLVRFERSAHSPFADEPEAFFPALRDFMKNLPKGTAADVARWKKDMADRRLQEEADDRKVSQAITFRTAEKAPEGFVSWTFFWQAPKTDEGAKLGFLVQDGEGKTYYQSDKPHLLPAGQGIRSDWKKGFAGGDPKDLWGKHIAFTIRVTKGQMEFPPDARFRFEFRDEQNRPIKKIDAGRGTDPPL